MDQNLVKAIDELAVLGGFKSILAPNADGPEYFGRTENIARESEYSHWSSDCAQILLCNAPSDDEEGFENAIGIAQRRLDELLVAAEIRKGVVVDGYLLIYLEADPTESIKKLVRQKEADTHLCRKHVVWHKIDDNGSKTWPRLSRVTVLGLPRAVELGSGAGLPPVDDYDPVGLWSEISDSHRAAAKRDLEKNIKGESQ